MREEKQNSNMKNKEKENEICQERRKVHFRNDMYLS